MAVKDAGQRYLGVELPGGFVPERRVGAGNFAWVFRGHGPAGEPVAIKLLHRQDHQGVRRFAREIKVCRELPPSPHTVRYIAHGEAPDGAPWFAMEFVDGLTLTELLRRRRRFAVPDAVKLMFQLCKGFAGLHRLGVAHRDIKPDNIMLTHRDEQVKIMDFGLVQDSQGLLKLFEEHDMVGGGDDFADDLDQGMLAGTPEYMAPEQISDPKLTDPAQLKTDTTADVYSLGVIFYQLLTGRKMFPLVPRAQGGSALQREVMDYLERRVAQRDADLVRPRAIEPQLWTIVAKAVRRDPKMRQGDATELARDLQTYMWTGRGIPEDEDVSPTVKGLPGLKHMRGQWEQLGRPGPARPGGAPEGAGAEADAQEPPEDDLFADAANMPFGPPPEGSATTTMFIMEMHKRRRRLWAVVGALALALGGVILALTLR